MNRKYKIEICANSVESAIEAQRGGAYRVELCAGIPEGGTTPSYGEIKMARELLSIRLHVIIRPRGGDFLYTPLEQSIMLHLRPSEGHHHKSPVQPVLMKSFLYQYLHSAYQ